MPSVLSFWDIQTYSAADLFKKHYSFPRNVYSTDSTNCHEAYILQIMGLNPPFGLKAILANKFIDKALTFKPKLIILIVPKETERYRNISWKLV